MSKRADRLCLILSGGDTYALPFTSDTVTDSEALHHALSLTDPGATYTVTFGPVTA